MSQYGEIMTELRAIREQNAWLVQAVKYLLGQEASWQPEAPVDDYEDLDLFDDGTTLAPDPNEHIAVRRQGRTRGCAHVQTQIRNGHVTCVQCGGDLGCAHNHQAIVGGRRVCARCGYDYGATGVVGRDPNAPVPGSETHEGSDLAATRVPSYATD